jgi:ABC-type transport system involved in Fe-S cluster assembly fused permease/ATPase subunit
MTSKNVAVVNPIIMQIAILLVSLGTIYGIIATKISTVEVNLNTFQQKYEREVVPRAEHIQMNGVLEQRLQSILERQLEVQNQMETMQNKIDELLRKSK